MNANDFTLLLKNPNAVSEQQALLLDKIVAEFPYFQSARALQLKVLHNQNSFRYNQNLKVTAAHTTDRNVLFEFITSENFTVVQNSPINEIEISNKTIEVAIEIEPKPVEDKLEQSIITSIIEATPKIEDIVEEEKISEGTTENKLEQSILDSINEATSIIEKTVQSEIDEISIEETKDQTIEEKLEIGQPLDFSKQEKHSFQEWLQLASLQPIKRDETVETQATEKKNIEEDEERKKKSALIDKFIETNPKITPAKNAIVTPFVSEQPAIESSYLMTETLAKVYLEQKKYQKAIQAYEILILKYPEKISFFASRISDIKALQQNNN
jgi:hypothetical protein